MGVIVHNGRPRSASRTNQIAAVCAVDSARCRSNGSRSLIERPASTSSCAQRQCKQATMDQDAELDHLSKMTGAASQIRGHRSRYNFMLAVMASPNPRARTRPSASQHSPLRPALIAGRPPLAAMVASDTFSMRLTTKCPDPSWATLDFLVNRISVASETARNSCDSGWWI